MAVLDPVFAQHSVCWCELQASISLTCRTPFSSRASIFWTMRGRRMIFDRRYDWSVEITLLMRSTRTSCTHKVRHRNYWTAPHPDLHTCTPCLSDICVVKPVVASTRPNASFPAPHAVIPGQRDCLHGMLRHDAVIVLYVTP